MCQKIAEISKRSPTDVCIHQTHGEHVFSTYGKNGKIWKYMNMLNIAEKVQWGHILTYVHTSNSD